MNVRCMKLMAAAWLAIVLIISGCGGSDGDDGAQGPQGPTGDAGVACWDLNENGTGDVPEEDVNGDGVVDVQDCSPSADAAEAAVLAAKPESCGTCHSMAGETHQAIYEQYVDESKLDLVFKGVSSMDNGNGTFAVTVDLSITLDGTPFVDAAGLPTLDQKRFYAVTYDVPTGQFLNLCSFSNNNVVPGGAAGDYVMTGTCNYAPEAGDALVYGYLAEGVLLEHEGGTGAEIPAGSHVHLYDNVVNSVIAFGAAQASSPDAYASAANVEGCEKCHGSPYLKHGYRGAQAAGVTDFVPCKTCHYDTRNGGHPDWQYMVDDPLAWATGEAPTADYSYTANVMNDTHMSHAMEFPYPMSMSNCVTCHEGKIAQVIDNSQFTGETCKSCHPVQGVDAWPGEKYNQPHRAPAIAYLWEESGTAGFSFHNAQLAGDCTSCHGAGVAPGFSAYHTGYDARIYNAAGERYADLYTVSIDSVTVSGDLMTIEFSSNNAAIVPEVSVSFYGWDTKDFLVSAHTRDANRVRMEYVPESSGGSANPLFVEEAGSAPGAWVVTLDTSVFEAVNTDSIPELIANGDVSKAEIMVTPELELGGVDVGLDAVTRTYDLGGEAFVDNYFKGTNAIVDVEKCDACHDQLAVTFHAGSGRGGDIVACRVCHVTTNGGSHLEMQSRSIDSYAHAIHSFQDFDVGDTFEEFDPVFAKRYDLHVKHVFPNFTINNCEACHVSGTVRYGVPDQSKSLPGLLSRSDEVATWYAIVNDLAVEDPSGRNIGTVPELVTGPASRACGACHRARLINQDEAGALVSFNAHTESFGTLSENDDEDTVLYGIIDKIMTLFE